MILGTTVNLGDGTDTLTLADAAAAAFAADRA